MHATPRPLASSSFLVLLAGILLAAPAPADRKPHGGMMRYPDVSATHIVFAFADDVWLVRREGGVATPLASPEGSEMLPRFSPDGQVIAFVGNYDGNVDLYTIPVGGGVPRRVTHHPTRELLCDWSPDGRLVFYAGGYGGHTRCTQLLTVAPEGGLPEHLPVPYGSDGAISPDGTWLAYTMHMRGFRTWKRYRGGMANDIWLFNLRDHTSKRITDWEGDDGQPMWHGHTVYYLSNAGPHHRQNIWAYDTKTGRREQITRFERYDVKWPAIGPGPGGAGEIVFQNGSELFLLDLGTRRARPVEVVVPGDRPKVRPQREDVANLIASSGISPTGKRATLEARGDIWTLPAEAGTARNLTRSSGAAERDPSWSPDGRWIAYFSDVSGEYELYITQSDGKGETRQLTKNNELFLYGPVWSPDSKHIAFSDNAGALFVYTLESDTIRRVDTDPWARRPMLSWSHDSGWIAYTRSGDNRQSSVWLYNLRSGERHQVTSGMFNDSWPAFDRKGDYLFFASNRRFADPVYEDVGSTWVYINTDVLVAVPLRDDIPSPWAPESDEETWAEAKPQAEEKEPESQPAETQPSDTQPAGDESPEADLPVAGENDQDKADKKKPGKKRDKKKEEKPLEIDLAGFESRAMQLPVPSGAFLRLAVSNDGKLIYVRRPKTGSPAIMMFDLEDEKKKEQTVLDDVGWFDPTADGKKLLVRKRDNLYVIDAKPKQKTDKALDTKRMVAVIDPPEEWRQLFHETWRLHRQFFYVKNLHGVDWPAIRDQYAAMLEDCVSRSDVAYVIREMISELNIGHAYYMGGPEESGPRVGVGMLGVDFKLHDGAYRIEHILRGAPWDLDARGPLSRPGVFVREGDYLLAVNGIPLDHSRDPWAAFQGLNGRVALLTFSDRPSLGSEPETTSTEETNAEAPAEADNEDATKDPYAGQRNVLIELADSESDLRYRDWVERKRAYVDQKTDGRVGYIYVPDTSRFGQSELVRQFFGQLDRQALIIDERWNGGGQGPARFIELLNRPASCYWAKQHGRDSCYPPDSHQGPKCMLINGRAGSGGDFLPYAFRQAGLGKLIGTRTWGGLVGIGGTPRLIDGTFTSVPRSGFYELDGTWGIEGHGVDPDIEVIDDPALMVDGGDPQLDAAIEHMLAEIRRKPFTPPKRPKDPDRSGMGIRVEDR